jgi:hypothetical protein
MNKPAPEDEKSPTQDPGKWEKWIRGVAFGAFVMAAIGIVFYAAAVKGLGFSWTELLPYIAGIVAVGVVLFILNFGLQQLKKASFSNWVLQCYGVGFLIFSLFIGAAAVVWIVILILQQTGVMPNPNHNRDDNKTFKPPEAKKPAVRLAVSGEGKISLKDKAGLTVTVDGKPIGNDVQYELKADGKVYDKGIGPNLPPYRPDFDLAKPGDFKIVTLSVKLFGPPPDKKEIGFGSVMVEVCSAEVTFEVTPPERRIFVNERATLQVRVLERQPQVKTKYMWNYEAGAIEAIEGKGTNSPAVAYRASVDLKKDEDERPVKISLDVKDEEGNALQWGSTTITVCRAHSIYTQFVVDATTRMNQRDVKGFTLLDSAKDRLIDSLTNRGSGHFGLRVFGAAPATANGCKNIRAVIPLSPVDPPAALAEVKKMQAGDKEAPLVETFREAVKALERSGASTGSSGKTKTQVQLFTITGGPDTCEKVKDPIEQLRQLRDAIEKSALAKAWDLEVAGERTFLTLAVAPGFTDVQRRQWRAVIDSKEYREHAHVLLTPRDVETFDGVLATVAKLSLPSYETRLRACNDLIQFLGTQEDMAGKRRMEKYRARLAA